ncbi:unnamed protein product [marine sediment metagenome]|uniref:Uncharacterized protein n=1 Tax=marine sediment metagenome TaxID=412755 RepID=X1AKS4_9ZZZZ
MVKKAGLGVSELPSLVFWLLLLGGSIYVTGMLIDKVKNEVELVLK